jgi:hypothetical protein
MVIRHFLFSSGDGTEGFYGAVKDGEWITGEATVSTGDPKVLPADPDGEVTRSGLKEPTVVSPGEEITLSSIPVPPSLWDFLLGEDVVRLVDLGDLLGEGVFGAMPTSIAAPIGSPNCSPILIKHAFLVLGGGVLGSGMFDGDGVTKSELLRIPLLGVSFVKRHWLSVAIQLLENLLGKKSVLSNILHMMTLQILHIVAGETMAWSVCHLAPWCSVKW